MNTEKEYWTNRYKEGHTGWDLGTISTPLKDYFDQIQSKEVAILIPGAGNGYEAAYLNDNGFTNVHILDISVVPLEQFAAANPSFPEEHIHEQDFFKHKNTYDLVIEQTFFCSFPPIKMNRVKYATKMASLLNDGGKLVGLWFDIPLTEDPDKRPFGGSKKEYRTYLAPFFEIKTFEAAHNSVIDRYGDELFGIFIKKKQPIKQQNNPLHGITLQSILEHLVANEGWEEMDKQVRINCFTENPTIKSSLRFLRKHLWAREKVEKMYLRSLNKN
ncbi:VF530 family DNA-binding protein [Patiriisocius sp. Uisw_017]|jgi:thiopurine S-methyltransferase|uniref:VF530 family DNA-binding protein n=1 Tax=Patiriisocius sp. Uisw_017 TaxID=3230968 RepID=UPI0039ED07C4